MNQPLGSAPQPAPGDSAVVVTVRVIAGVVGFAAGGLWLLCAFVVLTSLYSVTLASDPHGFAVVFGTLMGIVSGVLCAGLLPLAFARRHWARAYLIVISSVGTLMGLQFLAMYLS